ncbi:MAG: hypothetical protein LBU79_01630 [Planctomycetota bacterium]|jgi:hypothetical protein|nr:hypothetical protein [Planctomycetota bacterium]
MPEAVNSQPSPVFPAWLANLDPGLWRHPGEDQALGSLKKAPGFDRLLSLMSAHGSGKAERMVETASFLKAGKGIYPRLAQRWDECLAAFGVGEIPLHLVHRQEKGWQIRYDAQGARVILAADLLDSLPETEMTALLAGLAGGLKLGSAVNLAAVDFLRWFRDFSGLAGAPAAMLAWALENWRCYALMSLDRAAALATGEADVRHLLVRLAGGGHAAWGGITDPDAPRRQGLAAEAYRDDWNNSHWRRFTAALNRENTGTLLRLADLANWFASGAPAKIAAGTPLEAADQPSPREPGPAFWGEFAPPPPEADGGERADWLALAGEWGKMAEKGLSAFFRAGESFLQDWRKK